jgi:hypothetical protein
MYQRLACFGRPEMGLSQMPEKKSWVEPEIEEVALESEDEVLATCYTLSMSDKRNGDGCRKGNCATFF